MPTKFAHSLTSVLLGMCLLLGGCYAQDNDQSFDLGAVSIGDQLIDLKKARDKGVISAEEYRQGKADLLTILDRAATFGSDDSDQDSNDDSDESDDDDSGAQEEEDDEDSGFMF